MALGPRRLWPRFGFTLIVVALVAGPLLSLVEIVRRPPGVLVLVVLLVVFGVSLMGVLDTTAHHRAQGDPWPRAVRHGIADGVRFFFDALP